MKSSKGRPVKNNNTVPINELVVEFLATKIDKFDNAISYFKIVDSAFRQKLKPLFSLNDDGIPVGGGTNPSPAYYQKLPSYWLICPKITTN